MNSLKAAEVVLIFLQGHFLLVYLLKLPKFDTVALEFESLLLSRYRVLRSVEVRVHRDVLNLIVFTFDVVVVGTERQMWLLLLAENGIVIVSLLGHLVTLLLVLLVLPISHGLDEDVL